MSDLLATSTAADDELSLRRVNLWEARAAVQEASESLKAAKAYRQERIKMLGAQVASREEELSLARVAFNVAKVKATLAKYAAKKAYQAYIKGAL